MGMTRSSRTLSTTWRSALAAVAGACLVVGSLTPAQAVGSGSSELPVAQQNEALQEAGLTPLDLERQQSAERLAQATATDFYSTPAQLPAANGDLVRQEPSTFYLDPTNLVKPAADATRIMYRTTNAAGQPVATTGMVLVSKAPWGKPGPRPVVVSAPGTQGMGDQCAPSRQLAMGTQYEASSLAALVSAGYSVVVPDYVGLGTPGTHTYMNRTDQAHAVLDAARAAQRAGLSGISATTPVAMVGYSQGGGATAAAAELASSYAPELRIKSAWVGAPPADLQATGERVGTGALAGLTLYTLAAAEQYGVPVRDYLNAEGVARLDRAKEGCVTDSIVNDAFLQMDTLTSGGRTSEQLLAEPQLVQYLQEQTIGAQGRRPSFPVRIAHSATDDVVPYRVGRELAQRWCASGSNVSFQTLVTPTHLGGYLEGGPSMVKFLDARFSGVPQFSSCWRL